jgi:hypothetical protein
MDLDRTFPGAIDSGMLGLPPVPPSLAGAACHPLEPFQGDIWGSDQPIQLGEWFRIPVRPERAQESVHKTEQTDTSSKALRPSATQSNCDV